MTPKPPKKFDAVKLMRDLRDQISRDIQDMTFEEELHYIHERLSHQTDPKTEKQKPGLPVGSQPKHPE